MSADRDRYLKACHAMQTAVKLTIERKASPMERHLKHLRVGINSAMCQHTALVRVLIAKGLFTEAEYMREQADEMEREVARYKEELGLPPNVHLG